MDEIWSVDTSGGFRLKKSFGTALKFFGDSALANLSVYGKLAILVYLAWGDSWNCGADSQPIQLERTYIAQPQAESDRFPEMDSLAIIVVSVSFAIIGRPVSARRSITIVTGPSLTRLTFMSAAKIPRLHFDTTLGQESLRSASTSRSASSGGPASVKAGRRPRRQSASSVNWLTTNAEPPMSISERFILPCSSSKTRSSAVLLASQRASASLSCGQHPPAPTSLAGCFPRCG